MDQYTKYKTLKRFLEWEGIIGYTDQIWMIMTADEDRLKRINDNLDLEMEEDL